MTDKKLLNEKIRKSGLKLCFICDKLGITRNTFYRKSDNISEFKASQMCVLKDLLKLTADERDNIFFANIRE